MRILHLEDDSKDAELIQSTLEAEGFSCDVTRIDTEAGFRGLLERGSFDLVLADYTLPGFDGISALKAAKEISPDVPFIFVSGTLAEEVGVEALKLGATDFVAKTRLSRMAPAIRRALREAEEHLRRLLAERTLRESETYLAEAQRVSQTGSWAWNPATGDIRYWSDECFRVLGFDSRGPLPKFEEFLLHVHPDDRAQVSQRFEQFVRQKADFELDYRIVHPVTGVRDIHAVSRAVLGRSGELMEFVGTVIDVTEHKRAKEALQKSECNLAAIINTIPTTAWTTRPDGYCDFLNRGWLDYAGMTAEQAQGWGWADAIHPDDRKKLVEEWQSCLASGTPVDTEARIRRFDGSYRWFMIRANPLKDEAGNILKWYGTCIDIEDRKRAEG